MSCVVDLKERFEWTVVVFGKYTKNKISTNNAMMISRVEYLWFDKPIKFKEVLFGTRRKPNAWIQFEKNKHDSDFSPEINVHRFRLEIEIGAVAFLPELTVRYKLKKRKKSKREENQQQIIQELIAIRGILSNNKY